MGKEIPTEWKRDSKTIYHNAKKIKILEEKVNEMYSDQTYVDNRKTELEYSSMLTKENKGDVDISKFDDIELILDPWGPIKVNKKFNK